MNYGTLLKEKKHAIGVWGTGYIGFSTMAFFARCGVRAIGYDVSAERVAIINRGDYILSEMKTWLNFPVRPLAKKGYVKATANFNDFIGEEVMVHFVAIPTEKGGKPYFDILKDVIAKISSLIKKQRSLQVKPLVIIESTLSPRTSDTIVVPLFRKNRVRIGKDILYAVAPRRDWFVEGGKNLRDLDRVFGGHDSESANAAEDVLRIVCRRLHRASNCYVSEMVKSFENAYRHVEITLANQISLAYPSQNIREALELAGTKWNIGTFRPGFGTGGYCIPVASKYVIDGAESPTELTILKETVKTDQKINVLIADSLIKRNFKRVAVLGLSYKGNLKVSLLSPTIPFIQTLRKNRVDVRLFDPFFSEQEIQDILRIPTFGFPSELGKFEAVVVVVDHKEYEISGSSLIKSLKGCKFILDNTGLWSQHSKQFEGMGIEYHLAGDPQWL